MEPKSSLSETAIGMRVKVVRLDDPEGRCLWAGREVGAVGVIFATGNYEDSCMVEHDGQLVEYLFDELELATE